MSLRILGIVLAGGRGERLHPLTEKRSKPAVPFGGKYRIVDFVLSNFVNSGLLAIYVLVQYRSQSLIEHLRMAWRQSGRLRNSFITVVPPQMRVSEDWYSGTADAVYQNLSLIRDFAPDHVAVFGADHIYRMDLREMVESHLDREADLTVAARPVPVSQAQSMGVMEVDSNGRVVGFEEKPAAPKPMPDRPDMAYSSMGNYLFRREALTRILCEDAEHDSAHDFGRNIIPGLVSTHRVFAYDFSTNRVAGVQPYEEAGYWRDVGDIETYWRAHMDLLGGTPRLDLRNTAWPVLGDSYDGPPASVVSGSVENSMIGEGSVVSSARLRSCVIGRGVRIEPGAELDQCVIMDFCTIGKGARMSRVIVDRFNEIPAGDEVGFKAESDARRFFRHPSDLVVIPRGSTRFFV